MQEKRGKQKASGGSNPIVRVAVHKDVAWKSGDFRRHLSPANGFILIENGGSVDKVLDECLSAAPCVLIVDSDSLSEVDLQRLGERVEYGDHVQVVVMTPEENSTVISSLLGRGCMGVLADDVAPDVLKKALRAVASQEIWASRKAVSGALRDSLVRAICNKLSQRELEILRLIGEGLTNRAIAERLFISRETVRWHIRSLYSKTGMRDRLHAAAYAKRILGAQWISPSGKEDTQKGLF